MCVCGSQYRPSPTRRLQPHHNLFIVVLGKRLVSGGCDQFGYVTTCLVSLTRPWWGGRGRQESAFIRAVPWFEARGCCWCLVLLWSSAIDSSSRVMQVAIWVVQGVVPPSPEHRYHGRGLVEIFSSSSQDAIMGNQSCYDLYVR